MRKQGMNPRSSERARMPRQKSELEHTHMCSAYAIAEGGYPFVVIDCNKNLWRTAFCESL